MKKWSMKKILKEVTSTLLMVFVISMAINYIRKPDVSNLLPDMSFTLIDGTKTTFKGNRGQQPIVIHFWATWCPTCKLEASNIEKISDSCQLITVAVNSGSSDEIKAFMKERNLNYPILNDKSGAIAKQFDVQAYPTTFIYNSKGELAFSEVGYTTWLGLEARLKLV
ncbi:MAG TPA: redoxin domain-containing protein, partial [Campylobacterales bacterium]|nr:redoxin domain-containing protein [Campylobacterales bacterium]